MCVTVGKVTGKLGHPEAAEFGFFYVVIKRAPHWR